MLEFDWDAANEEHIARHRITRKQAEDAVTIDWRGAPLGYAERPAYARLAGDPCEPQPVGAAPLCLPGAGRPTEFRGLLAPSSPAVRTARPPRIAPREYGVTVTGDELRITYVGPDGDGRMLFVVVTPREDRLRVVTAYPARREMRRFYREAEQTEDDDDQEQD